jgi:hypothetical protein
MMIRFEDIKIHVLVYIDNAEWGANGWFCVTGTWDEFFDAEKLGNRRSSTYVIFKEDVEGIVKAHIRMTAVPGAIEALQRIEMTAGQPAMDDDPVRVRAREALRAVRWEESA